MKVENRKMNIRWIAIFTSLILVLSLCVIPVEAKQKLSTKKVVTIYGSNGKAYKSGSTIPLSALDGASIKISGVSKDKAYNYTFIVSVGKYKLSEDNEPNWAYDQIAANKASLRKLIKKERGYDNIDQIGKKISCKALDYCTGCMNEDPEFNSITFELQPLDKKLNYTNTYYENYFKVDVNK